MWRGENERNEIPILLPIATKVAHDFTEKSNILIAYKLLVFSISML